MSNLPQRTVHVKGFQAPINPAALQAGLRRFGYMYVQRSISSGLRVLATYDQPHTFPTPLLSERIHLWTSASGKEHAFVVYKDADAVDAAVGSYKAVTVEHIRKSPDLQARLKEMSESWSKRFQNPSIDAGGSRASNFVKPATRQPSSRPPYSDSAPNPTCIRRPEAESDLIRRNGDQKSKGPLDARSSSRRAFPEGKHRLIARDEPEGSGHPRREKLHNLVDFDYDFSKYPTSRRRSRERSPKPLGGREKDRVPHRSRNRGETSPSAHRVRVGDNPTSRPEPPSQRSGRPRRGRSPTSANHSGHRIRRSHVSPHQEIATSPKRISEKPSKVAGEKTSGCPQPTAMTRAIGDDQACDIPIASFQPVIKMEPENEPVALGCPQPTAPDAIQGCDQLPSSCSLEQSPSRQTRPRTTKTPRKSPSVHLNSIETPVATQITTLLGFPSSLQSLSTSSPVQRALQLDEPPHVSGLSREAERHVVRVIREAYKEDALEAHRKACLLITEYGNKAMWDLADLVGHCSQRKASGLSVPPMRPIYLALATCKARQARTAEAADQRNLMLASSAYINSAEDSEEAPVSLNFIRLNRPTPSQDIDSDGASTIPSSQHLGTSKPKPVEPIPTQPRSRPFEMQALRMQVTSLRSSLSAVNEDIRTERVSKRKAEEYLSQEKCKARRMEGELKLAEEDKQRLKRALQDERARRTKAEDEVWKLKKSETNPQPIPSWYF
ncbi:hypothetical protein FRC01_003344 [Tulasnella sp. 417]|nr:hypothetical protein FRC01_003344 [Tulasnella sp. 417]